GPPEQLAARRRDPRAPGSGEPWASLFPTFFPLLAPRWEEFRHSGYVTVRMDSLPPAQREPLLAKLRPLLHENEERMNAALAEIRAREAAMPSPGPVLSHAPSVSTAEQCALVLRLSLQEHAVQQG